jgi:hypothetical protein
LRRGVRPTFRDPRTLIRIVYRDPQHVSERLTLYAAEKLAEPSRVGGDGPAPTRPRRQPGANPTAETAAIAEELRSRSASIARTDGAITGTLRSKFKTGAHR